MRLGVLGTQPFQDRVFFFWLRNFGAGFGTFDSSKAIILSPSFFVVEDMVCIEDVFVGVLVTSNILYCSDLRQGDTIWSGS